MSDEIREITIDQANEPEKKLNPFDYVTIPMAQYTKMVRKIERIKVQKKADAEIAKVKEKAGEYRRWWREEEKEKENLKEALEDAKKQIKELLGVEEIEEEEE